MENNLTAEQVEEIVAKTVASLARDECRTCDCFQGFLVQLELDADEDVSELLARHRVPSSAMHGCLGCNPCPPGAAFARYLKQQQELRDQQDGIGGT